MKKIILIIVLLMGVVANQTIAQSVTITTVPNPPTICSGSGAFVALTAVPVGLPVIGYSWAPGGGTTQTINVSPPVTTMYTVTVTFLGGITRNASVTVNVLPAPTPTITPGGPTTFCQGGSVLLTSSAAVSYQWYVGGSIIPGATNQTYTAVASGSYTVIVNDGACNGTSAATVVTVNPLPIAIVTPAGPINLCFGGTQLLTAQAGAGYTYQWQSSPTGLAPWTDIPGATNQTLTVNATGYYRVAVTFNGCTSFSN